MVWDQSYWWESRDDYSFGYLVPLFALYVIYDRKEAILGFLTQVDSTPSSEDKPNGLWICNLIALASFITGALLYLVGGLLRAATMPQNPATLAISMGFALLLLSSVFIFSSETIHGEKLILKNRLKLTLLFLFPALIWLISAPLVSVLETKIRVFLLTQVTIIVFTLMEFLGFEIERQGNVLVLPKGVVGVEEACSGIRSLTACLFAGSFLASVYLNKFWKKFVLVFMAMVFAVLTNLFRSGFLTLWAYFYGSEAINDHWVLPLIGDIGSVHDVMGMAVLVLTTIGLLCLLPILNFDLNKFLNRLTDSENTN
jgi:exosortase